jgi:hypothetical protein
MRSIRACITLDTFTNMLLKRECGLQSANVHDEKIGSQRCFKKVTIVIVPTYADVSSTFRTTSIQKMVHKKGHCQCCSVKISFHPIAM